MCEGNASPARYVGSVVHGARNFLYENGRGIAEHSNCAYACPRYRVCSKGCGEGALFNRIAGCVSSTDSDLSRNYIGPTWQDDTNIDSLKPFILRERINGSTNYDSTRNYKEQRSRRGGTTCAEEKRRKLANRWEFATFFFNLS